MSRRILSLFFALCLFLFCLVSCQEEAAPQTDTEAPTANDDAPAQEVELTPTEKLDVNGDGAVKILALGNSFSNNAFLYLHPILSSAGVENLTLGNLITGSCSLSTVSKYTQTGGSYEAYHKFDTDGVRTVESKKPLLSALIEEDWDIISIQQVSGQSGQESTYSPHLDTVINYINANRTVKDGLLVWHMTWAYQQGSTYASFANYNRDQMTMYNAIVNATVNKISSNENIDLIIPAGTAIQNARTSSFGDTMTEDGYHLNNTARVIASYAWVTALLQEELSEDIHAPSHITAEYAAMARAAANATLANPLAVTEID